MAQDKDQNEDGQDGDVDSSEPPPEDDHHHNEPWVENIFKTNDEMPLHSPESVV